MVFDERSKRLTQLYLRILVIESLLKLANEINPWCCHYCNFVKSLFASLTNNLLLFSIFSEATLLIDSNLS